VQVTADGNGNLQDQTNREGLVSNDAYTHLQHVLLELLAYFEARRFASRRASAAVSGSRSVILPLATTHSERIDALLKPLAKRRKVDPRDLERIKRGLAQEQEARADALRHYAGLAATGQLASAVFARILQPLRQVHTELALVRTEVDALEAAPDLLEDARGALERASLRLREAQLVIDRLDPLARPRKGRRLLPLDLESCVQDVVAVFSDEIGHKEVDFRLLLRDKIPAYGDVSIVEQVLALVFDNALFWLTQISPPRLLRVLVDKQGLTVENNGPPIPAEHRPFIFDAHFTTREDASGMGLTLARDLLRPIGGRIGLSGARRGVGFRVDLSKVPARANGKLSK
jgi:signal transduction histidine kinase